MHPDGGQAEKEKSSKTSAHLPWQRVPITISAGSGVGLAEVPGMDARLLSCMLGKHGEQCGCLLWMPGPEPAGKEPGGLGWKQKLDDALAGASIAQGQRTYTELFPVQSVVWTQLAGGCSTAHDLCIAAPTGSGKTLAYALPVINGLARYAASWL